MLNPLTKHTKAQSHDSRTYSNQKTLRAKPTQYNRLTYENTSCLCAFVRTNSYFSGEGIDFMLGALDLLVARGRDDLRVVRHCSREG